MNDRNIVKQSHKAINSKYNLTSEELKLTMLCIAQIKQEDKDFNEVTISGVELSNKYNISKDYTKLKKLATSLMKQVIYIENKKEKEWEIYHLFDYIKYKKGTLIMKLDFEVKEHFLNLKNNFSSSNLKCLLEMKSQYSIRMYNILKQRENQKFNHIVSLDELFEILQVPKSLKAYGNFKPRVLERAKEELEKFGDIKFNYKEIKEGQRVIKIEFIVCKNKQNSMILEDEAINAKINYKSKVFNDFDIKVDIIMGKIINFKMIKWYVADQHYNFSLDNCTLTLININTNEELIKDFSKEEIFKYYENLNRLA